MRTCSVEGCEKGGAITRGMCRKHYVAWLHEGGLHGCSVPGCETGVTSRGMCIKHYARWMRTGTTDARGGLGYEGPFTAKATCSPTTAQIAWAAGFIEGEGSFACNARTTVISVSQVNREPLDRLLAWFGGRIVPRPPSNLGKSPIWEWKCSGSRARGVAMTLYSMMSVRRKQQIRVALGIEEKALAA